MLPFLLYSCTVLKPLKATTEMIFCWFIFLKEVESHSELDLWSLNLIILDLCTFMLFSQKCKMSSSKNLDKEDVVYRGKNVLIYHYVAHFFFFFFNLEPAQDLPFQNQNNSIKKTLCIQKRLHQYLGTP